MEDFEADMESPSFENNQEKFGSNMEDFLFGAHPLELIGFSIVLILICLGYYVIQSGLFATIDVKTVEPKTGPMVVAYKTGKGPYKGCGDLFTEIYSLIMNRDLIGIYYDDPEAVPPPDLRYAVGVILAEGSDQEPDQSELDACLSNGYKVVHFPKPNHVVLAEFPFKNTLSIYMGIFRVYPKLKEYIASRSLCAYPALEIYAANKIKFIMPLSKQEEFFVPEFCEEQVSIATTEFSNHPADDQALNEDDFKKIKDEDGFIKPTAPAPKSVKTDDNKSEPTDLTQEVSEEEESSEFEQLEPEN